MIVINDTHCHKMTWENPERICIICLYSYKNKGRFLLNVGLERYLAPLAVAAVIAAVTGCSASPKTTTSSGSESTAAKQTPQEAGTEAASEEQAFQGEKVLVWTNNRHT